MAAVPFLRRVLEDLEEDPMCRHEAAEALGALGDEGSLEILRRMRDDTGESKVVRETCEIAVERIEWEHSGKGDLEKLKNRFATLLHHRRTGKRAYIADIADIETVILHL